MFQGLSVNPLVSLFIHTISDVGQTEDTEGDHVDDLHPHLFGDRLLLNGLRGWTRKRVWQLVSIQPRG